MSLFMPRRLSYPHILDTRWVEIFSTIHCVKSFQIRSFFWSIFSPNARKYGPEKTPYLDTFHAVIYLKLRLTKYLSIKEQNYNLYSILTIGESYDDRKIIVFTHCQIYAYFDNFEFFIWEFFKIHSNVFSNKFILDQKVVLFYKNFRVEVLSVECLR